MKLDSTVLQSSANKPFKLQGHTTFAGMSIAIENKKGSVRSGVGANGRTWSVTMPYDYGYIKKSVGKDGDEVDCFIGLDRSAKFAYVIHQCKEANEAYDEDKVMLGFSSADAALRAYRSAFNGPDLYRGMSILPIAIFKEKVKKQKTRSKIHAVNYGGLGVGDDYRQFREGTALQPMTNNHPPSLTNPQKVKSLNPDEDITPKSKSKKRRKAQRDFYKELARRQVDKPTIAQTTLFVPLSQG